MTFSPRSRTTYTTKIYTYTAPPSAYASAHYNNTDTLYPLDRDYDSNNNIVSTAWENITQDKMTAPATIVGDLIVFVGQFLYDPPSSGAASSINWAHSDLYPKDFNSSGTDISSTTGDWNFWFRTTEGLTSGVDAPNQEEDNFLGGQGRQFVVGVWYKTANSADVNATQYEIPYGAKTGGFNCFCAHGVALSFDAQGATASQIISGSQYIVGYSDGDFVVRYSSDLSNLEYMVPSITQNKTTDAYYIGLNATSRYSTGGSQYVRTWSSSDVPSGYTNLGFNSRSLMYGKSITNKEVVPETGIVPTSTGSGGAYYTNRNIPRQTLSLILQLPALPFLYHEKMYKFDGNKYPDSTFAYSVKSSDITDIKEHQVGILINDSDESSTAIRSYRGFNPTGGDVLFAKSFPGASAISRFFFVRPNTDIYGLITNDINPIYLDISGNTLATLGMTSGGASVDYKFYDTGTLTVSLSSQDSSNAPSNIDTGTSFQWYYSTVGNQKGYLSRDGLISYPITGQTAKNYIPSASGTPGSTAKSVRCGVTYASGAKTVYSQWTPTNTYYYALATTSGAPELAPGNSGSFVLSGYVGTPTTLYYSIDEPSGASYSLSGSDFANGSISGTVSVSGNSVAIPIRTTNASIGKLFNVNIRQDSTSGTIIGTSSSITSDFKTSGNAAPSLGRSFITSGNYDDNASSWAGTGWQNIFSGVPNSSNIGSNNISAEVALGFDFKIDGNTYTSVYVTSHAWLQFGTGASTTSAAGSGVARLRVANNDESTSSPYYIVRAAKFVTSNYVTLRLEYGNQSTRTFNQTREITGADGQGFICIEVTFLKGDVYGTPIIETRVGQSHFFTSEWQQSYSGYGYITDYTQNFYSDSGSTTLAEHSTAQDTSTLLVANDANGNSWTAYSAAGLASAESYALSHSGNATEGNTYAFTLATSNVTNGSTLYYDIVAGDSGNTPTAADFEGITSLTGNSFSTTNDSTTINLYPINDGSSSEGEGEVFKLRITDVPGSLGGQLALSNSVTLVDGGVVSYSVSPSATIVNEGGSITFTVNTSNVVDTTTLYYTIDSNTNGALYGSSSDFTSSLSGTIGNISSNTVSKAITIATDSLYEPAETFYFSVRTGSTSGTIVARSSQITISEATTVLGSHSTNQLINSTKQFTINTTNAANNTLYWFITSNSAGTTMYGDSNDFTTALSGAVTVNSSGDSITLNITASNSSSIGDQYYLAIKSTENLSASNEAISSQITIASAVYSLAVDTQQPYVGANVVFTLATEGVSNNTTLDYFITSNSSGTQQSGGSFVEASDFNPASLTGTFNTTNNSTTITLTHSSTGTANEQYYLAVKSDGDSLSDSALAVSPLITLQPVPNIAYVNSTTYTGSGYMFLSGIQANDFVMVASVADSNGTGTITATNAGTITKDQSHSSSSPYHAVHYFRATGTSTEINVYNGNWIAFAFRNVNTTTPLDVTTTKDSSGSRPNPPAITTSTDNTMIVAFGFIDDHHGVSALTAPSGYTQAAYNYNSSYNASVMAIYKALPSAGTDDPGQFGGDTDSVTAMTFALRKLYEEPSIVSSGLILHLDAGNSSSYSGSGTAWNNLISNNYNATLTNGPTYSSADGGSIVFDGSDDSARTNDVLDPVADGLYADSSSSWSVSSWFKPSSSWSNQGAITGKGGGNGSSATYVVWYDSREWYNFLQVRLRGGTVLQISNTDLTSTWSEVTITWDGSTAKAYLNGSFVSNITVGTAGKQSNTFTVGSTSSGNNTRFGGNISEVKVYSDALTASEVTQNYNALKGRYGL